MAEQNDETKIKTPVGILSYPHLFTPQASKEPGKKAKYSATIILFPPGADLSRFDEYPALKEALKDADLKPMVAAAAAAAKARWGDKAEGMMRSGQLKSPFRKEGDVHGTVMKEKGYPEGCVFLNLRSDNRPQIVSRFPGADGKAQIITDETLIYPGCLVRLSGRAFGYDNSGNKGIAFGLNNVQKWADGPRLDGRAAGQDEFDADLKSAPEELGDVMGGFGV